jgi:hypothetical protein
MPDEMESKDHIGLANDLVKKIVKIGKVKPEQIVKLCAYAMNSYSYKLKNMNNSDFNRFKKKIDYILYLAYMGACGTLDNDRILVELDYNKINKLSKRLIEAISLNENMGDTGIADSWLKLDVNKSVYLPLSSDIIRPYKQLSQGEIKEIFIEAEGLGKPWMEKFIETLVKIVSHYNKASNVIPIDSAERMKTINIDLLAYSDCLLLGTLFKGIEKELLNNNITISIGKPKIVQKSMVSDDGIRIGYSPESLLRQTISENFVQYKDTLIAPSVIAKVIRNDPIPTIIMFQAETDHSGLKNWDCLSPLANDNELYRLSIPNAQLIIKNLSEVSMPTLVEHAHWLNLLLASQSRRNTTGVCVIPTPDQFVWAREAGILSWRESPGDVNESILQYKNITSEYNKSKSIYPNLCIYFRIPALRKSDKNIQDKSSIPSDLIVDMLKMLAYFIEKNNDKIEKILSKLDDNKTENTKDDNDIRNGLMTVLYSANPDYKGAIPRLSLRGLLRNVIKIKEYESYLPLGAILLNELDNENLKRLDNIAV